jgi:outer membrane immunogenic protein
MRRTVKILVGFGLASSALVAAAPGQAADIYRPPASIKDTGPIDYAPPITWTGFYIGGNIGAVWPSDDLELLNDDAQFIGGGHLGYNWQGPSNWVVGIEGDANFSDDFEYLATVRGRLGYAMGRTLLYGTGGVAFAGFNDNIIDDDEVGWVAGGGVETKIRGNMSLGLEALYYDFEDAQTGGVDNAVEAVTVRGRLTVHMNGNRDPLK